MMLDFLLGILQGIANSTQNNYGTSFNGVNLSGGMNKYLQGDLTLKNIATAQQLTQLRNSGQLKYTQIPTFIFGNEMNINHSPLTNIDFYKVYLKMIVEDKENITLNYHGINQWQFDNLMQIAQDSFEEFSNIYPELTSYFGGIAVRSSYGGTGGTLTLTFTWDNTGGRFTFNDIQDTIYGCAHVINELKRYGKISDYMSQYEKAKVIYQWVIFHSQYAKQTLRATYTPNGFLFNGSAVCQAYVGVFNLLCKMVGINIVGIHGKTTHSQYGSTHIWSFAVLDGKPTYIDVTWGDPVFSNEETLRFQGINPENICDFKYFDISKQELMNTHSWKNNYYEDLIIFNKLRN